MVPTVLLLNKDNEDISKFGFEFTHLTAKKLKSGLVEVTTRWSCAPDHLQTFEAITEIGAGRDRGKSCTTDETYEEDIKSNVFSFFKFEFEKAEYSIPIDCPGMEPDKTTVKIIVALNQEGQTLQYVPVFTRAQRYGCSVYFADPDWDDEDDVFHDEVFEE